MLLGISAVKPAHSTPSALRPASKSDVADSSSRDAAPGLEEPIAVFDTDDLDRAARRLRRHVAYITAALKTDEDDPLEPETADGYALATGPRALVCQAFLVKDAEKIQVEGPKGTLEVEIEALDVDVRVARLVSKEPLASVGLYPATESPASDREVGMDLIALVSTLPGASVVSGELTELGDGVGLDGNLRSSLRLTRGMPAFDTRLRWVGLARVVAWDPDRSLLIPPELTRIEKKAPRAEPPPAAEPERPWWAR